MTQDDSIPLSALNQYGYCPRRCFLIHAEGEFEDNIHTQRGTSEHERVDTLRHEVSAGVHVEYGLPVWSDRLGLVGKCDVVEFHPNGGVYPVEYKHGPRRKWLNDDLQVAAQALCLEEMTGRPVPRAAIYHAGSRRRREVDITPALRQEVEATIVALRGMMQSGQIPPPVNDKRCKECSLNTLCQPEMLSARARISSIRHHLFDPEG
jgi:CRISPR-associated exonuclease Cas4